MQTGDHGLCLLFVKWIWEHTVPRKDNRSFYQILQLADVARPGIRLEGRHGFRRNAVDLLPHAATKELHEMRDQSWNIFPALSERRQQDGEDVQPIIQVTAKLPASDHLLQIAIGRGYQPDIHFVRATIA